MKKIIALLCAMAMAFGMAACGQETTGSQQSTGETTTEQTTEQESAQTTAADKDTLVFISHMTSETLDPLTTASSSGVDKNAMHQIFDCLLQFDNDGNPIPCLAESWEDTDDGKAVLFHLRQDVTFHDGTPFNADAVVYTFDKQFENPLTAYITTYYTACEKVDDYTVKITKATPHVALLPMMAEGPFIVSPTAYEKGAEEFAKNPVGTGAYKFVDWLAGDRVILERNEDYWGEAPEFKNLIIRTMADETTRAMALENGEIDIAVGLGASQIDMLNSSETASVITFPSYITQYCGLNCSYEPLSDKRVRQALRYAVDMDTITEIAYSNGVVADGPFVPTISSYVPAGEDQQYEQDIEKAKQLLKEAGYENGFDLEISVNENQARITIAEMLANAWSEIGINATVSTLEFSAIVSDMYSGNTQAFIMGFGAGGNDGDFYASPFHSEGDTSVWIGYSNPEVDRLFDLAGSELDEDLRNSYYAEVQTVLRDDLPWLWLRFTDNIFGMQKNLTGLDLDPETYCEFRFVKSA